MTNEKPPGWILKPLLEVCPEHLEDEVIGDFLEYYTDLCYKKNRLYANKKALIYLMLAIPRLLVKRKYKSNNQIDMLKSYFIIAFRNIKKHLGYSLINIVGLAIGLACCLLIGLYIDNELGYDSFHENSDQIYRTNLKFTAPQGEFKTYTTPTAVLPTLRREFNEVESGVRVFYVGAFNAVTIKNEAEVNQEKEFFYVDSTFFDVFDFKLISGNADQSLTLPNSLALTEKMAMKYFGKVDVLNETLQVNGSDFKITAVLADLPPNSHFQFDFIASFSTLSISKQEIWGSANYATYVKLKENADSDKVAIGLSQKATEAIGENLGPVSLEFSFIPLKDIHLKSDIPDEMQPQNSIRYIYIISIVGVMILIIACINYMNLATARSLERAKEVGMRKVLGAFRKQVFGQFIGESFITTGLSLLIAVVIVGISLKGFNNLSGKSFIFSDLVSADILLGLFSAFLFVSFIAGAYPAIVLSSYNPGSVLKGVFKRSKGGNLTRQLLVVIQFTISITLLIGTFVVSNQLDYLRNKRLGYNKENVLVIPTNQYVDDNFEKISTELERRADVIGVSIATESPVNVGGGYSMTIPGLVKESININAIATDDDFLKTMQMNLLAGRHFNESDLKLASIEDNSKRKYAFIVNEEVLSSAMVSAEEAVGQPMSMNGRNGEIVGVVENFHSTSLHSKITPLVLFVEPDYFNTLFIRIKPDNMQRTIIGIEDTWKELIPGQPFAFEFMDEEYDALYRSEVRLGKVFAVFAVLAIIIASLGLFGLVSFAVTQRSKEIGIRKVLGASVPSIVTLLGISFAQLIAVAFIISIPIAWYSMNAWLTDFSYKITIGPWAFIMAGFSLLVVALATVSYQSFRAATSNPVDTLRSE